MRLAPAHEARLSAEEALEVATDAYVYAYPLVLMEVTRRIMTNVAQPNSRGAPMNQFAHMSAFPDASFTDVVSPNADTLYSPLWFDVSSEPLVVGVPEARERYYLLPMLDMWTDVFASLGTRTTGPDAHRFAVVGPRWKGTLPDDVEEIRAPTERGWIIGRTQTNGKQDYDAVHAFQRALSAVPLSALGTTYAPPSGRVDSALDMSPPSEQVARMDAATFWRAFADASVASPPHAHDYPILQRMQRVGLAARRAGTAGGVPAPAFALLDRGAEAGLGRITSAIKLLGATVNGWTIPTSPMGTYGSDYLRRAAIAMFGLGANLLEDAFYPFTAVDAEGRPLDSAARYVLHFDMGQTPPARAFWSLTMYNERQLFTANPIDRHAIGDRDDLRFNPGGSLDLYVQRTSPGSGAERNWLPTPADGRFSLMLRIYWPDARVIDGTWEPPALRRVG